MTLKCDHIKKLIELSSFYCIVNTWSINSFIRLDKYGISFVDIFQLLWLVKLNRASTPGREGVASLTEIADPNSDDLRLVRCHRCVLANVDGLTRLGPTRDSKFKILFWKINYKKLNYVKIVFLLSLLLTNDRNILFAGVMSAYQLASFFGGLKSGTSKMVKKMTRNALKWLDRNALWFQSDFWFDIEYFCIGLCYELETDRK